MLALKDLQQNWKKRHAFETESILINNRPWRVVSPHAGAVPPGKGNGAGLLYVCVCH